jgi:hypothetical protein
VFFQAQDGFWFLDLLEGALTRPSGGRGAPSAHVRGCVVLCGLRCALGAASGGILPLANFGTVHVTGSLANGAALGNAGGVTQIIMIDNAGRDKNTVSSLTSGENFSATWLRSS